MSGPYVRFDDVPGFYAVAASRPLHEILTFDMLDRYQLGIGELKLPVTARPRPTSRTMPALCCGSASAWDSMPTRVGHISFIGDRLFRTSFAFPSTVPTGIYNVDVYLVRDGKIVDAQSFPLLVNRAGFSADIYNFAHRNGLAYGVIAVLTALIFGWIAHLAFRRR